MFDQLNTLFENENASQLIAMHIYEPVACVIHLHCAFEFCAILAPRRIEIENKVFEEYKIKNILPKLNYKVLKTFIYKI